MKLTIKHTNLQQVMIKSKEFICFPKLWVCTHVKMMVVDGYTVLAGGYNLTYEHLNKSETSVGGDEYPKHDAAIQVSGPIAQEAL